MLCPQLKKRGKAVRFYLPEGSWKHYFNGKIFQGGAYYKIKTPMGEPAVFERLPN
jgi:alpha-glucosidase (family GH31 glycosyl hydrolase)